MKVDDIIQVSETAGDPKPAQSGSNQRPAQSSSFLLLPFPLSDPAVINCRVALLGAEQQQRAVGRSRDFLRTDTGAVLHVRGVGGPDGQEQLRTLSCCLPVPAEGGVGGGRRGRGDGSIGGVQQGALQGGVLPDSHLHSGGWQGGGVLLPPETFKTPK